MGPSWGQSPRLPLLTTTCIKVQMEAPVPQVLRPAAQDRVQVLTSLAPLRGTRDLWRKAPKGQAEETGTADPAVDRTGHQQSRVLATMQSS